MQTDDFDNDSLRRQVQRLEAIVESSADAIMIKDLDGRYRFVNQAAADHLGREKDRRLALSDVVVELEFQLTDAQSTALRASYFSGYYEWPRDSTAEEIADSLDISSSTLHQHVRKAQRELLATFFDHDLDRP